jgi:hypothetical protein
MITPATAVRAIITTISYLDSCNTFLTGCILVLSPVFFPSSVQATINIAARVILLRGTMVSIKSSSEAVAQQGGGGSFKA